MTDRPWESEPDHEEFTSFGLDCVLCRGPVQSWCGYVRVDKSHLLFGVSYGDKVDALGDMLEQRKQQPIGEAPSFAVLLAPFTGTLEPTPDAVFQVHGGLTYSGKKAGGGTGREGWWFGFDCSHSGDLSPGLSKYHPAGPNKTYRTIDYARKECERLAAQLKEIAGYRQQWGRYMSITDSLFDSGRGEI